VLPETDLCLVFRVLTFNCALPLQHVSETMRPLPVEPIAGAISPVAGIAIIRGCPVPVVDVAWLIAGQRSQPSRFVTIDIAARRVALAVDTVVGVRTIHTEALNELPPLLQNAPADVIAGMGTLDAELLVVLRAARLVPEPVWDALEAVRTSMC
jgi:purine-binding chemotaxis protein CheW